MSALVAWMVKWGRWVDHYFGRRFGMHYHRLVRDPTALERAEYLLRVMKTMQSHEITVLDVGCGGAWPLEMLCDNMDLQIQKYLGIDMNVEAYGLAERYTHCKISHDFVSVDLTESWNLGEKFDIVYCAEVIEHIMDDQAFFRRLCDHVSDNGILILTTPNSHFVTHNAQFISGFDQITPIEDGGHVRIGYDPKMLDALGAAYGMKLVTYDWISRFSSVELMTFLRHRKYWFVGAFLFNLRHSRSAATTKYRIGDENIPHDFYSIAGVFKSGNVILDK